jgi:GntR family phosphonate transport system transcriptional regulator
MRKSGGPTEDGDEALGYVEIADLIRRSIPGKYGIGDKIASERVLAAELGVNRHTVRRALQKLETQGVISTVHGAGSVVVHKPMEHRVSFNTRFTASAELAGISARTEVVEALSAPTPAEDRLARKTAGIAPSARIVTLRYADGVPVCWIRHLLFGLQAEKLADAFQGGSLHDHIDRLFGIRLRRRESRVSADRANATDVRLLLVARDLPILCSSGLNVDAVTGRPIELSLTRFRSDAVDLRFDGPDPSPQPVGRSD